MKCGLFWFVLKSDPFNLTFSAVLKLDSTLTVVLIRLGNVGMGRVETSPVDVSTVTKSGKA